MNQNLATKILKEPHKLGHLLGYSKLTPLHDEWIRYIWYTNQSRSLQAHRGSYKTTGVLVLGSILSMIFKPNDRTFIVRKEFDGNVKPVFREIKNQLLSDEIKYTTKELYGFPLEIVRASSNEIEINYKTKVTREANLTGASIKQMITGQHYDRIITDDIINIRDRVSTAERENTKLMYQELYNIVDPGLPVSNIGTPWHKDDAFSIMPEPKIYPIGSTDLPDFTSDHILNLKNTMSSDLYAANYELKHVASDNAMFKDMKFIKRPNGKWIAQIDASYHGKDTTVLTLTCDDGDKIIQSGHAWPEHVDECMSKIKRIFDDYKPGTLYMENNADKGYLAKEIRKWHSSVSTYHESMNKHIKIVSFLKKEWQTVYYTEDTNDMYIEQIADYMEGIEPDDAPDSAASSIRIIRKRVVMLK